MEASVLLTAFIIAVALTYVGAMGDGSGSYRRWSLLVLTAIGLCGLAVVMVVQLRHVLTHPVVADDEVSLTADVIMRVEDARDVAVPTVVWSLPVVSVFSTAFGWWQAAWLVFIVLSVIALALINARTPRSGMVARHATNAP